MRRLVALVVLLAALGITLARRAGLVSVSMPLPDGPGAWLASRAGGLTAYLALSLEMAFGLFLSTGVADRWIARARAVEVHRWLSLGTLALAALHAGALLLDRVVPFDLLEVAVPFLAPWRRAAVGVGVLAAWIVLAVHASFAWRDRLGTRGWRWLHLGSYAAWLLATAHGVLAGTDARQPLARAVYLGAAGTLVTLTLARLFLASRGTRAATTKSPSPSA